MTRILRYTLAVALLAALVCGCSSDDVIGGGVPSDETQVSFILKMSDAAEGTRAGTWGDEYEYFKEKGEEYDKRINPNNLKVALYDVDGKTLVANVDILAYYKLDSSSEEAASATDEYRFIGSVKAVEGKELSPDNYKIMVFANCVSSDQSLPSDLSALSYDYDPDGVKECNQLIPMWGVTTAPLKLKKGQRDDVDEINLLRAFAKVEINLHDDISGTYTITSATLNKYNTQGYCLPAGYAGVGKTDDLDQEGNSFNPYSSREESLLFFVPSPDKKSAYLYIPEYANSDNSAQIQLTLSDGKNETTGTLYFKNYTNGAPTGDAHDIVRNHIYRYTVNVEQGTLIVQAKVMPWQLVTTSIGWMPQPASTDKNPFDGTSLPANTYILLPVGGSGTTISAKLSDLYINADKGDDDARYCILTKPTYVDDGHKILKTGTAGARYFFMLTGPEGATWEAHLTNEEDFGFSYSSSSDLPGESVQMVSHGIARENKPYIIQINAKKSYTGINETAETDENGNIKTEDDYAWYLDDKYRYVDGTKEKNHVDDISKESDSWWDKDKRNDFYSKYNEDLEASFDWLTEWGKEHWNGQKVIDTEFYITVKLKDGTEYELTINPSYDGNVVTGTRYKGNRRYAGTDTRIWIRQVKAQYEWGYDDLAKDVSPTSINNEDPKDNFQWWRVNPYWKK